MFGHEVLKQVILIARKYLAAALLSNITAAG